MPDTKIAIIDFKNQDSGLKILFPTADYFILEEEFDRTRINRKYNITPIVHNKHVNVFDFITDEIYDTLFIIAGLYSSLQMYNQKTNQFFNDKFKAQVLKIVELINKNNFKHVCFFDNEDYDYDPNIIFDKEFIDTKPITFFKRYMNKEKKYHSNVMPFPYIIFGYQCNIEMVTDVDVDVSMDVKHIERVNRLFFTGTPLLHIDNTYGIIRNRKDILNNIQQKINLYNPGNVSHDAFMHLMKNSKYSLDLLGCGDPNIRTFEILSSGSLRISQRSNLKWNFEEDFCEETIFDNENDLLEKMKLLESNPELYKKCIDKQNHIVKTYMNKLYLKEYIHNSLWKIK
jgi:hypothetical protein